MTITRVSKHHLPDGFTRCGVPESCPYMSSVGYCDMPRYNKGNSDAACHRMSNKELLEHFASPLSSTGLGTPK